MKTVQELEAELEVARKLERELSNEKAKHKNEAYKALPWEWRVKLIKAHERGSWDRYKGDSIRVECRKVGYEEFILVHGKTCDDNDWVGMNYYRTDEGILTSIGGGSCVLRDPKLCSDDEWASLCKGVVPDNFKNPNWIL